MLVVVLMTYHGLLQVEDFTSTRQIPPVRKIKKIFEIAEKDSYCTVEHYYEVRPRMCSQFNSVDSQSENNWLSGCKLTHGVNFLGKHVTTMYATEETGLIGYSSLYLFISKPRAYSTTKVKIPMVYKCLSFGSWESHWLQHFLDRNSLGGLSVSKNVVHFPQFATLRLFT